MEQIKSEKVKLQKRIKNTENYYITLPKGSEIHIVDKNGYIKLSIGMREDGIHYWGNKTETQEEIK